MENTSSPIVYLGTIARASTATSNVLDLLSVKEDGEIECHDGDSLQKKWSSPSNALTREMPSPVEQLKVEFVHQTTAHSASQGILKGRQDILALFPQEVSRDGFNPEILVIVTKFLIDDQPVRMLHIVGLPRRSSLQLQSTNHSVESLLMVAIPSFTVSKPQDRKYTNTKILKEQAAFSIQVSAGLLQILEAGGMLTTYDLCDTLPKEQSKLMSVGAQSFLRLSSTSAMISAGDSIIVYNPKYQSKLAEVHVESLPEPEAKHESLKRKRTSKDPSTSSCKLIAYFPKLGSAVGIADNNLIAVQVEGQQGRLGKPRAAGLLIDSLGCSMKEQVRPEHHIIKHKIAGPSKTLGGFLPGTLEDTDFLYETRNIEKMVSEGKKGAKNFDIQIAKHLGGDWANTVEPSTVSQLKSSHIPKDLKSSDVDRRWVKFALSKIFSFSGEQESESPKLTVSFCPPQTFNWLLINGYMTITNIEASIRHGNGFPTSIPAGQLADAIVEVDPNMDLLLALLAKNYLEAAELLHAIRLLMTSFGLIGEDSHTRQLLLTNGDLMDITDENAEAQAENLEVETQEALELAEYQLGPGSSIRGQALSLALSKLYTRPNKAVVSALQRTFNNQEIESLIYLLRFELARGAWTTRYIDGDEAEIVDEDADIPDNAIVLVSSLLNSCVDAIGAGGWLSGEARLIDGDTFAAEELIASLKLEVSAALEGIEEAAYLKGLTSEIIRYGDAVQKALPMQKTKKGAPVTLPSLDADTKTLPLGMKAEKLISRIRVGTGGIVQERSMRNIGYLKSQNVGKYSRERIVV